MRAVIFYLSFVVVAPVKRLIDCNGVASCRNKNQKNHSEFHEHRPPFKISEGKNK